MKVGCLKRSRTGVEEALEMFTGIGLLLFFWFLLCCVVAESEDREHAGRASGRSSNDYSNPDDEDYGV
jgi:hypothetical protein